MDVILFFDGLCEPNPGGFCAWSYVLWLGKKCISDCGGFDPSPNTTCNFAEWCALGFGLKKLKSLNLPDIESLTILGDSKLVVMQLDDRWRTKAEKLILLRNRCREMLADFPDWVARWIPRELNHHADSLCNKAYKEWQESLRQNHGAK